MSPSLSRRPATSFGITAISPGEATENNGIKQAILDAVDFVRENGPQLMVQAFKRLGWTWGGDWNKAEKVDYMHFQKIPPGWEDWVRQHRK